jgi:hypothetical protein
MGTNYYFRRNDNRTRYFMGKEYALARRLERHGPLVVTHTAVSGVAEIASTVERRGLDARELAALIEIGRIEDGYSEYQVAPTGRDKHGTSLRLLALALDVTRWSGGMPISFVSEDRFEDWQDDDAWDENVSTAELIDASEVPLTTVLGCVRAIVRSGRGVLTFPSWSVEIVGSALSASARTFTWRGLTGMQLGILDVWAEAHRGSTVEGGPIPTTSGVIASAVDIALRVLDDPKLDLSCLSDYCAVLVEYAETGPQESVREAVQALVTAMNACARAVQVTSIDVGSEEEGAL